MSYVPKKKDQYEYPNTRNMGCDEIQDIDFETAIRQLMFFFNELLGNLSKELSEAILCQVMHWIATQPSYIRALMPILDCEN